MYQQILDSLRNIVMAEPDKLSLLRLVPILFFIVIFSWLVHTILRSKRTYGSRYPVLGAFKFWASLVIVFALAVLALARPFIPAGGVTVRRGNIEIVFLIDYSSSMFLKDTGWARIDIAVREVTDLLASQVITEGDRVALYVFGNRVTRRVPMTKDLNLFANEVNLIGRPNTLIGESIYWSSDMASAFERVYMFINRQDMIAEFGKEVGGWQPKPKQNRLMFIFTDGADIFNSSGASPEDDANNLARLSKAIEELNRINIKVYPIGIGTRSGAFMTDILRDYKKIEQYDPQLENDLSGQVSRLDVKSLQYIKNTSGSEGPFLIENERESAIHFIKMATSRYRSTTLEPVVSEENKELWQYFLIAALIVFLIGVIITKF